MRGKSAKGFIFYRLGLVSITKTHLTNLSCSSDSEASHQDTEIVKVGFLQKKEVRANQSYHEPKGSTS